MRNVRTVIASCLIGGIAWSLASVPARAQESANLMEGVPTVDELVEALTPAKRELTRGIRASRGAEVEASRPAVDLAVNFEFNSDQLTPKAQAILDNLATALNTDLATYQFVLEGHTDAVGSAAYNQALSERRARVVREYLVERYRVDGARLTAVGKGERELLMPEAPDAASNRRVRIVNDG